MARAGIDVAALYEALDAARGRAVLMAARRG